MPEGFALPNGEIGTGQQASIEFDEIPCDFSDHSLTVACGQAKTFVFTAAGPDGELIDVRDRTLVFVVESQNGIDIETGPAIQNDDLEIRFSTQVANGNPRLLRWSVRDDETGTPIRFGSYRVLDIAKSGVSPPSFVTPTSCHSVTVNDGNGIPISGVCVDVTSDAMGAALIATGRTDSFGVFEFKMDPPVPENIYVWRSKKGFRFTNPILISVNETVT